MLGFIKIFLQGILYVVLSPLILLILALYAVYCTLTFIYMAIKAVIVFFMGGTPMGDLPEDVEAKRILLEKEQKQEEFNQNITNTLAQTQAQMAQMMFQQQQRMGSVPVFTPPVEEKPSFPDEDMPEDYEEEYIDENEYESLEEERDD